MEKEKFRLKNLQLVCSKSELAAIPKGKQMINTINAFSYNNARKDAAFAKALRSCDALVPDGMSIVKACRWIDADCKPKERIAGWDLFTFEMSRLNECGGTVMFMGSTDAVLTLIKDRAKIEYPNIRVCTYSPPYKEDFSEDDNRRIVNSINACNPDLLWIGMTAPKQEKWVMAHWSELDIHCHCGTIGAVFDFFAGTTKRAPLFWQRHGLEWLYRFIKEPRRLWRRYILGNVRFLYYMLCECIL